MLVSTTIIESGLDIPSANTLIVNRADRFGLAQLYQLRGRVGRAKTRAYAYLTTPARGKVTETAEKRLHILQNLDTLGAGFQLASHDLDIRGAGNLLGDEQSGHIKEVGFELYQSMLEEAILEAKAGGLAEAARSKEFSPQINSDAPILIPEAYVPDLDLRMGLYRRLNDVDSKQELEAFSAELIDRFGPLPEPTQNLLTVIEIKMNCRTACIAKLDVGAKGALVTFFEGSFPRSSRPADVCRAAQGRGKAAAGQQAGRQPRMGHRRSAAQRGLAALQRAGEDRRMMRRIAVLLFASFAGAAAMATMTWSDLTSRPKPAADAVIAYGADPLQHVDLWRPRGAGPFPVVLMVHGGCWSTDIATADLMNWIAGDLRGRGIAVWNIEYRGVDRPGGGYPGTFQDVAAAAGALRIAAPKYRLSLDRVVAVGHSAGGHLALWLAARPGLSAASPLRGGPSVALKAVISLGGLPDLQAAATPPGDTCGANVIPKLVGRPTAARPDVYADTSPALLPQPAEPVTLVNGSVDPIAPPYFADAYAARVGGRPRRILIGGEGHVELITPGTKSWQTTVALIESALR